MNLNITRPFPPTRRLWCLLYSFRHQSRRLFSMRILPWNPPTRAPTRHPHPSRHIPMYIDTHPLNIHACILTYPYVYRYTHIYIYIYTYTHIVYFDINPKGPPSTGIHSAHSRHIPLALPPATLRSPPQPLHTDTRPLNIHAYIPAIPAPRHPPYMHIYRYTHIYI